MWRYEFLNYFFFCFHTALIFFNTFGWIFCKTRKWNLITLLLTAFSWFVLGIWYGWGYCFCTDWHWSVRRHLGYTDKENSYTQFLADKLTGKNFSATFSTENKKCFLSLLLILHEYYRLVLPQSFLL